MASASSVPGLLPIFEKSTLSRAIVVSVLGLAALEVVSKALDFSDIPSALYSIISGTSTASLIGEDILLALIATALAAVIVLVSLRMLTWIPSGWQMLAFWTRSVLLGQVFFIAAYSILVSRAYLFSATEITPWAIFLAFPAAWLLAQRSKVVGRRKGTSNQFALRAATACILALVGYDIAWALLNFTQVCTGVPNPGCDPNSNFGGGTCVQVTACHYRPGLEWLWLLPFVLPAVPLVMRKLSKP